MFFNCCQIHTPGVKTVSTHERRFQIWLNLKCTFFLQLFQPLIILFLNEKMSWWHFVNQNLKYITKAPLNWKEYLFLNWQDRHCTVHNKLTGSKATFHSRTNSLHTQHHIIILAIMTILSFMLLWIGCEVDYSLSSPSRVKSINLVL